MDTGLFSVCRAVCRRNYCNLWRGGFQNKDQLCVSLLSAQIYTTDDLASIRLATHFYKENLLDAEHYLEWFVASLESASLARLPILLLLVQIYWKDLLQHRKHGRRLSSALMKHLREVRTALAMQDVL